MRTATRTAIAGEDVLAAAMDAELLKLALGKVGSPTTCLGCRRPVYLIKLGSTSYLVERRIVPRNGGLSLPVHSCLLGASDS